MWVKVGSGILLSIAIVAGARAEAPVPVAPGAEDGVAVVAGRCPTFHWAAVAGAESVDLVVYRLPDDGEHEPERALSVTLPGSAQGWTPALAQCLEPGRRYAWSVGVAGEWSEAKLFGVSATPSQAEVEEALAVLQRYVGTAAPDEAPEFELAEAGTGAEPTVATPLEGAGVGTEGAAEDAIVAEPPSLAPIPLQALGVSASVMTLQGRKGEGNAIGVRGEYDATLGTDLTVGYLGVAVADTSAGSFDGFDALKALDSDEIGVLGLSVNSSYDNFGVVGVAVDYADAGRFLNTDPAGNVRNEVLLGTDSYALHVKGNVRIEGSMTGPAKCPSGLFRAGAWCISQVQAKTSWTIAAKLCWNQGLLLCPTEAMMACDLYNPPGANCTTLTDQAHCEGIWLAEIDPDTVPWPVPIYSDIGYALSWSCDTADWSPRTAYFYSFCCSPL